MRELKHRFKKGSRTYTQLHRQEEDFYIYQVCEEIYEDVDEYYEVFCHRLTGMHPLAKDYDPDERVVAYPSNENFGYWAWCCSNWKCVLKVLREHFDYTDQEILNLVSGNPKLAHLGVLMDNYTTDGEKSDLRTYTEGKL